MVSRLFLISIHNNTGHSSFTLIYSIEEVVEDSLQAVWECVGCRRASKCENERAGFRDYVNEGGSSQGSEGGERIPIIWQTNGKQTTET